jgi:hypothetical protein
MKREAESMTETSSRCLHAKNVWVDSPVPDTGGQRQSWLGSMQGLLGGSQTLTLGMKLKGIPKVQ